MKYSAAIFSDIGISTELGKRILDVLAEKKLDVCDLNTVLWRMRDFIIKTKAPALLEKLKDDEIGELCDQIILERAMYASQCPQPVCCAETEAQLFAAFDIKEPTQSYKVPESAWFFQELEEKKPEGGYKEGDLVTLQIFRVGKWEHSEYGTVEITKKTIKDVIKNFNNRTRGVDLCVDENHEPDHKALAWYKELFSKNDNTECFAKVSLTKKGADLLNEGAYKYFSPEICFSKVDEESGESISNLLIGGAFTNRPFFKGMQPLMATEGAAIGKRSGSPSSTGAYFFSPEATMHKLLLLLDKLVGKATISASEKAELEMRYNELPKEDRSDDINKAFAETVAKFDEGDGSSAAPAEVPAEAAAPAAPEAVAPAGEGEAEDTEGVKPEGTEGEVQANEDGTFKVDQAFMDSVKGMQKNLAKVSHDATVRACEAKTRTLCFSDSKKTNVVLPKHVPKIAQFAAGLSETQRKVFFDIVGSLKAVPAGSIGHANTTGTSATVNFNDPKSIPADDEKVGYFMETMHQSLEEAQRSAAYYYAEKAKKA